MQPFTTLTGIAAPLMRADINTDAIIPMRWLVTATRDGLGRGLFSEWRRMADGAEDASFVLNQSRFRNACILITGSNFGCGSSREHAPWALLEYGIRCIIAPSFASIFYENALKNGLLPVALPAVTVEQLAARVARDAVLTVDLASLSVRSGEGRIATFELDVARRTALLEGRDEIDDTLRHERAIAAFQAQDRLQRPWVWAAARHD